MCIISAASKAAGNADGAGGTASAATLSGYDKNLTRKAARWRSFKMDFDGGTIYE